LTPEQRIPIPGTERMTWPGSRQVGPLTATSDVLVTAWLGARSGGQLDRERAQALGSTPPLQRTYADRKTLAQQTGTDPADVELLRRYCERFGVKIAGSHWRSLTLEGPLEGMVSAFGATVAVFEDELKQRFRHRSDVLRVPPEIAAVVRGIFGLHQWPRSRKLGALERHAQPLLASDVGARYQFPSADGSGQTIAAVQLRGEFKPNDFNQSMRAQGVAPALPIIKRVDDAAVAHEVATTHDLEAALDVQIMASLAPAARIIVYEAPDDERGCLDAIREAIFDEEYAPSVLSISYGWPEQTWTPVALDILDELFTAAALIGISVFCSSGDNGAELNYDGKPHVLAPASSPFVVSCGATVSASTGGEEQAWERSGGGFSARGNIPPWQQVAHSSAAQYGVSVGRGVPDVAAQQSPGYYVVVDGVELAMGGTSAVAPLWSALTARINQRLGVPVGFFAPLLYGPAAGRLFSDVTAGSNGPYQAAPGWDPCTGLGTPIGSALEEALSARPS
jgi:kumamolisin